jgi:uncharacterized protein (DUF1697 family)
MGPSSGWTAVVLGGSVDMKSYIALLRGINVGGHKKVAMADLRALVSELGFADVRSLLQSGNLVFRSSARSAAQIEHLLEAALKKRLALQIDVFVRTAEEWEALVTQNPLRAEAERDPSHFVAVLFKQAPPAEKVKELRAAITGPEVVRAKGREAYIVYPDDMGHSRLTNALIEKKLGTRATARNWNTVLKLRDLASA